MVNEKTAPRRRFAVKKLLLIVLIAVLALIVLAVAAFFATRGYVQSLPTVYGQTFSAGLADKYDRLKSVEGRRLVVVGGSSVAFGLDSVLAEELMGVPCVNFGMYAELGTRVMLDLSLPLLHSGDIVVVAPELERKTLSFATDWVAVWKALDGRLDAVQSLGLSDGREMIAALPGFLSEKRALLASGTTLSPEGVYARSSLNEYGDVSWERPYNIMALGYDPTNVITPELGMYTEQFIGHLNEYVIRAAAKGALVYYSFPPIDKDALGESVTEESLAEFTAALASRLVCPIISDIRDLIMAPDYFYDTNFHLNDVGKAYRTEMLVRDIRRAEGDGSYSELVKPAPPDRPEFFVDAEQNDVTGFFLYEKTGEEYVLTGLTEEGKKQKKLTIPYGNEGRRVVTIGENAFAGGDVEEIVFPADTYIALAVDGAFGGASKLQQVRMYCGPDQVLVGEDLLRGAVPDMHFMILRGMYGSYAAHYFWSAYYRSMIVVDE